MAGENSIIISLQMFNEIASKLTKLVTGGRTARNPQTGSVTLKDPTTGIFNMIARTKDALLHDFSKGVWIGKRPIGNTVGYSSILLENSNLNPMHYGIMVDGKGWHLSGVNGVGLVGIEVGGPDKIIKVLKMEEHEIDEFEWFYKGETVNPIGPLVQAINKQKFVYNGVATNCIVVAKALWHYVRGLISIPDAVAQIRNAGLNLLARGTSMQNFRLEAINLFK